MSVPPSEAQRIAELVADLDDNDRDALAAWVANHGVSLDAEQIDRFREAYRGLHDSEVAYAQEFADDIGAVNEDASWPNTYIDWERAARDLFMDLWSVNALTGSGIHVFHDC